MKRSIITTVIVLLCTSVQCVAQGNIRMISGTVTDGKEPLAGANVFIYGTIDGCTTDSLGRFRFETDAKGEAELCATYIGYEDFRMRINAQTASADIVMREKAAAIDEVVVTASSYVFGRYEGMKSMNALDIVMSGNSCGDIYAALQSLPGTQKVGESGKLYVRGGDETECQTFINGMHVMVPYSTNVENNAVRGRFSPFLFKGMNFSLGGYDGEYGGALSAVLPMETTDISSGDKLGVSLSPLDWSVGGTKAFSRSSLSFNASYLSMAIYNKVFPDRYEWNEPYRKLSGEVQYKAETIGGGSIKTYAGYDLTTLGQQTDGRNLALKEHNIYVNSVFQRNFAGGINVFAGIANSTLLNNIDNAELNGDCFHDFRNEIHIKTSVRKTVSNAIKVSAGIEDYIRNSSMRYAVKDENVGEYNLAYNLLAVNISTQTRLTGMLYANVSARTEMTSYNRRWIIMPRATLSVIPGSRFRMSLATGKYSQAADNEYIAMGGKRLRQGTAYHYITSAQYHTGSVLVRAEAYYKKYRNLPRLCGDHEYTSDGYGMSRGMDLFIENTSLIKNLTTTLSYSYNDAKRLYLDYTEPSMPQYSTRHNVCFTAKYYLPRLKTYIGMAENFASGRPYHAPMKSGFMNSRTAPYNSLDMNITVLVSPRIILYASMNNVLGRTNVFNYNYQADGTARTAVTSSRDRFLYIGLFISLKNNKAYEISNF